MSLCLITPVKEKMQGPTHAAIIGFALAYVEQGEKFFHQMTWLNSFLPQARADLLAGALSMKTDHILFVDDDMTFTPADIFTLIDSKKDCVSGMYRKKNATKENVGILLPNGEETKDLLEMERIGLGCALFTSSSLRKLLEVCPYPFLLPPKENPKFPGRFMDQDEMFSLKYREMGNQIFVHKDVRCGHLGPTEFKC